jgi:dihydrodipicolinate reductase
LAYAKSVDPGNTGNLWRTQNPLTRATPAIFSERKSVGAGLLANAVSQTTNALRQNPIRGQARSYSCSAPYRQPSAYAKSVGPGNTDSLRRTQNPFIRATPAIFSERKSVGAGLLANAVSQTTNALRQNRVRGQARSYS